MLNLQAIELSKTYRGRKVVDEVELEIGQGEVWGCWVWQRFGIHRFPKAHSYLYQSKWRSLMRTSQAKQDELRNLFHGEVIEPSGIGYDEARRGWNGAVDHHPALIVRPVDAAAVSVAVCFANRNGMPIAVLGGGYDWAGRSVRSGLMVF